jgi:hypothetical protein
MDSAWTPYGPWVQELRACWKKNHRIDGGHACVVDLNEVTFTDTNGERLLRRLAKDGAQFIASGIYTKHILEQSVGTSAVTTLIARRGQYHQSVLAEYTRSPRFNASVAGLANRLTHVGLSPYSAHQQALDRMYRMVIAQAQAMSYVDVYWLLAATGGLMFLLSFLLAKNEPGKGGSVAVG